ncbi:endo alpha-1,4 polygalactosaminidase [uncultured Winogradskyella sp.]|uniref:endo alpha-1,4 polygalactosaminidase n=1 Tax=uncultured Winogradskyella sp. TaxID=395353 RepID=UPI00261E2CCB|nr:endo alpha-1,4 polygalactosaminidase [uncultured Winogradskyella sp.]
MNKPFVFVLIIFCLFSCNETDDSNNDIDDSEIPSGSENAKAIYNQAYQENFEEDNIEDILATAQNAYVLIDPFQEGFPASIAAIKANGNDVGAYISIGTGETYRDDFDAMSPYLVSDSWGEWPDEYFVNSTTTGVLDIMKARIDQIALWGCDWVEFDNMDWCYDDNLRATYGFQVTETEGVAYYQELCTYVQSKGMKCMAKNTVDNASNFDGVLYESYNDEKNWWDQSGAQSFLDAGKLVIINHYNETSCSQVYSDYISIYNDDLSFICEDANLQKYRHYNE